ncbi:MAG: PQQ-binding-like beta-propeller repeat protein [Bdellovibrionales bacterium]
MRTLCLLFASLIITSCSGLSDAFTEEDAPPLEGERISVLELQKALEPDDALLESQGLMTPQEWQNEFWPQNGGYPNHSMQNLALASGQLQRIWKTSIGRGSTDKIPLTAPPIVVEDTIYALDTKAELSAFSTQNGKRLWKTDIANPDEDDLVIGGGIAFSGGRIFATNGYNELLALSPKDGKILWRKALAAPARAAPTIVDYRVFVTTLDNRLLALSTEDGANLWEYVGIAETAGLIGAASPAANRDIVIPAFSSGEIVAIRTANGSIAWSDNISNVRRLGGLGAISDIKALPVIDKGLVIAISFAGRLVAIDERTGTRIWQREISGAQTPWMAGNHLFVLSSDNKIIALGRETGTIRWVTELPKNDNDKILTFTGPVLAGGRLIMTGSNGSVIELSPENGEILREWDSNMKTTIPPIIAGGKLFILGESGTLSAYQ